MMPNPSLKASRTLVESLLSAISFGMLRGRDVAIDVGTASTLVHVDGLGVVVNQPSIVLVRKSSGQADSVGIQAFGDDADRLEGRTPAHLECVRPIRNGVISDFTLSQSMIGRYAQRALGEKGIRSPVRRLVLSVPAGATQVDLRALRDATQVTGATQVFFVEEALAAAVGAGLPVHEPVGSMIIEIGAGTTEIAVVTFTGLAVRMSSRVGGDRFDHAIQQHLRRAHSLLVDETVAREIKVKIGSAFPSETRSKMTVTGRCLIKGLPKKVEVDSDEIRECYSDLISEILALTRSTLESTPPSLLKHVLETQIMLSGGGSKLQGLDRLIQNETGIKVTYTEDPQTTVIIGCGKILAEIDRFREIFLQVE